MKRALSCFVLSVIACQPTPSRGSDESAPVGHIASAPVAAMSVHWPSDRDSNQVANLAESEVTHQRPCGATPQVDPDSVGPVSPGRSAQQVLHRCPGARLAWDWGDEGIPEPAMLVRLGSGIAVVIFSDTLPQSHSYRVTLSDTVFRTKAGVGPGSSFGDLVQAYGAPESVDEAECVLFATFKAAPGLTWRLHLGGSVECEDLAQIAQSKRVNANAKVAAVTLAAPGPGAD